MANHKLLILTPVGFAAVFFCAGANAGYAQLSPPSNWANNAIRVSSNDLSFAGGVRSGSAVVNVAGKAVVMPAAYRFASNASRVAAGIAYLNPGVFTAIAVGSAAYAAYEWYKDSGFEINDGVWKKKTTTPGGWYTNNYQATHYATKEDAFRAFVRYVYGPAAVAGTVTCSGSSPTFICSASVSAYGNSSTAQTSINHQASPDETSYDSISKQQFEDAMAPKPVPLNLPQVFPVPGVEWPVDPKPIINPSADPVPVPQPMRVPQGEPQPVPGSDPAQWKTPVVDIVPSPTDTDPWRVDLQPKDILKLEPNPMAEPEPVITEPAPGEETPTEDFCSKNPTVIACQTFTPDEITATPVVNTDRNMSIQNDAGWATGGSCPADRVFTVRGFTVAMPFTLLCDFAAGIRPIVIALAYLSAAAAFIGFGRR